MSADFLFSANSVDAQLLIRFKQCTSGTIIKLSTNHDLNCTNHYFLVCLLLPFISSSSANPTEWSNTNKSTAFADVLFECA